MKKNINFGTAISYGAGAFQEQQQLYFGVMDILDSTLVRKDIEEKAKTIKPANTKLEKKQVADPYYGLFAHHLAAHGFRYTVNSQLIQPLEGNPDFVLPADKCCIFLSKSDKDIELLLNKSGWKVFWFPKVKNGQHNIEGSLTELLSSIQDTQTEEQPKFTFIDLFSGIGGFRIALNKLGGKCLGFSEIDKPASETYKTNFVGNNDAELELGDITKLGELPFKEIDLIVGGVPCQSWSVAGKMRGFDDPRGKLWNDSIRLVALNTPKAFIFENVKGLMDPRNKANLDLIETSLRDLGYKVKSQLLNSHDFGLPQNRDRIFIVGIRNDLAKGNKFDFPAPLGKSTSLSEIMDGLTKTGKVKKKTFDPKEIFGEKIPIGRNRFQKNTELNDFFVFCDTRNGHTTIHSWDLIDTTEREKEICLAVLRNRRKKIYGDQDGNPLPFTALRKLVDNLRENELTKLVDKKILRFVEGKNGYEFVNSKNSSGINGIYRIYLPHSEIFSTLTATGTKDMIATVAVKGDSPEEYRQNFINQVVKKGAYRAITAKESGKLQGFPNGFAIHKDERLAKKQFGNAVSTSVIYYLGKSLLETKIFNK
ncbi:DNA (cytosine-5-)-methyltransferase [Olivibacter sp. SDN3]|uniref:DNA (cytosine-5-)-methyltransferase n=1 Tax=Olivibacter sp. SDN3 TaxID=2764720 RepID=UPI001C9E4F88|nr:DNA (cytosine-5-)-methyltransferase [Olivibacter sp. SDN3]